MDTIPKKDLAERIARAHSIPAHTALAVIQDFLDGITAELAKGNRLEFRDFGVFQVVHRKGRKALNPKTLEKVMVPPHAAVKFKVGRVLRARVDALPLPSEEAATAATTPAAPPAPAVHPGASAS